MLESFLQAQKVSVRRSLQRNFRKYITYGEEANQLLMHRLQDLVRDEEMYQQARNRGQVELRDTRIDINDLQRKAQELNIYDLTPFFNSSIFRRHNFRVDLDEGSIIKEYL